MGKVPVLSCEGIKDWTRIPWITVHAEVIGAKGVEKNIDDIWRRLPEQVNCKNGSSGEKSARNDKSNECSKVFHGRK